MAKTLLRGIFNSVFSGSPQSRRRRRFRFRHTKQIRYRSLTRMLYCPLRSPASFSSRFAGGMRSNSTSFTFVQHGELSGCDTANAGGYSPVLSCFPKLFRVFVIGARDHRWWNRYYRVTIISSNGMLRSSGDGHQNHGKRRTGVLRPTQSEAGSCSSMCRGFHVLVEKHADGIPDLD